MTEEEWLTFVHPHEMFRVLGERFTRRKWRLMFCAYCRDNLDLMPDVRSVQAIELAELDSDGNCPVSVRNHGLAEARKAWDDCRHNGNDSGRVYSRLALECLEGPEMPSERRREALTIYAESLPDVAVCTQVREFFGNPFRPVAFDPAWRTQTTIGIASAIYEDRAFERMPILADALEEAGCEHPDILAHCREPGTHVRGCWVVDLVLGKT